MDEVDFQIMIPSKYQDLSRFSVPKNFRAKSMYYIFLWWIVEKVLFKTSPRFFWGFRRALLKLFGAKIGKNVRIRPEAKITYPWKLAVGDNSWIGEDTVIYNLGNIEIGSNVAIAHRVYLCSGSHNVNKITFDITESPILISDEVWIANDVFIGPGVRVGFGSVIGARSSVFKDMPPGHICFGTPCKPISERVKHKDE